MLFRYLLMIITLVTLFSCKNKTAEITKINKIVSHYYFVRHAEKDTSNPDDHNPELTKEGLLRAENLSMILKDANLDAVYATNYTRTINTAKPTAIKSNIEITIYKPSELDVTKIINEQKNTLIVGHSNSTPKLVNRFIKSTVYEKIDEDDYSNLYHVIVTNGEVSGYDLARY